MAIARALQTVPLRRTNQPREPAAWLHSYLGARPPGGSEAGVSLGTPQATRPRAITRWLPLATVEQCGPIVGHGAPSSSST